MLCLSATTEALALSPTAIASVFHVINHRKPMISSMKERRVQVRKHIRIEHVCVGRTNRNNPEII